jgi:hypothetical protein
MKREWADDEVRPRLLDRRPLQPHRRAPDKDVSLLWTSLNLLRKIALTYRKLTVLFGVGVYSALKSPFTSAFFYQKVLVSA